MPAIEEYNRPHIDALVRSLSDGNVALLVGAGTSIVCGYPGWGAFLAELEQPIKDQHGERSVERLRSRHQDLPLRLDKMAEMLGPQWQTIFAATFAPRDSGERAPEWVRLLFDLNARLIVTTNYTDELREAAERHPATPLGRSPAQFSWWKPGDLDDALRGAQSSIKLIHLHGRHDDDASNRLDDQGRPWSHVILGAASYRYAYEDPGRVHRTLMAMTMTRTLLFVGSSLADADMRRVLESVRSDVGQQGAPHFAVLPLQDGTSPSAEADLLVARYGLRPVYYETRRVAAGGEDHSALEDLLRELVDRAAPQRPSGAAAVVPLSPDAYPPSARIVHKLLAPRQFEPRPEFENAVAAFLSRAEGGVLSLVGMGGSGKTAIVERAIARELDVSPTKRLDGLFVWSFFDTPDVAEFLRSLAGYLTGKELAKATSDAAAYELTRRALAPGGDAAGRRIAIVMDGLETRIAERADGGARYGSLDNQVIRQFLLSLGREETAARVVVTTRVRPVDMEALAGNGRVYSLDVDSLTRVQARRMLRSREITGSDRDLDEVVDRVGTNALTLEHLAGVLVALAGGEAHRWRDLGMGPMTRFRAGIAAERFAQLVETYQQYLEENHPLVRATLEAVAVFPRFVTEKRLAGAFLDPRRSLDAGFIGAASPHGLHAALERLADLQLIRRGAPGRGVEATWTLHPTMRDAVLETTGRRRAALARVAAAGMLSDVDRFADPDGKATTAQALDHVETVIDLLVDANEFGAASDIYITWLGGYERLGKSLGAYDRGIRLVRRLLDALNASKVPIPRRGRANLISDLGLFLKNAGRVAEARSLLVTPDVGRVEPNQASVELQNASDIEVLAGRLPAAEEFAARALETSADAAIGANKARAFSLHYQASALAERGRLEGAAALLAESRTFQNRMDDVRRMQLYSNRAVCAARLLMRLGEFKRALRVADAAQKIHFKYAATFGRDIALTRLVLAEAQLGMGSVRAAAKDLSAGRDWTLASGNMELLVRCRSIEARMRLRTGDIAGSWAEAREMLAAATTCGFGLLEIDARNLVSEIALARDDATTARAESERALAASDTESCDYFWGRIAAHGILHDATLRLGDGAAASEHARRAKALGESVRLDEAAIKPLLP